MNKRYIDFVPAPKKNEVTVRRGAPKRVVAKKTPQKMIREVPEELPVEEILVERPRPAGVSSGLDSEPKFGVIEDYKPKFVQASVEKRPLGGRKEPRTTKVDTASPAEARPGQKIGGKVNARSQKIGGKVGVRTQKIGGGIGAKTQKVTAGAKLQTTEVGAKLQGTGVQSVRAGAGAGVRAGAGVKPLNIKFVNTNKIEKRPLSSRRVAARRPTATTASRPSEKPKGPETIIAKPEKNSKAGLIVAVILTIILGAAAGTVAFLIMPK